VDIYIQRIGFTLIRVHRYQQFREVDGQKSELLSQMKWPIEYMFIGLRPAQNISRDNLNQYRDWHRLTLLTDQQLDCQAKSQGDVMTDDAPAFNAVSVGHKTFTSSVASESVVFSNVRETIQSLQLQAHGITIYQTSKAAFFRDYLSYTFGGANLNTPEDLGALFMNFALYPGTYNPSGHMNVSRAREFYLEYVSDYVTPSTPADLLVLAIALNFLLISDGSAVLRYST
jgi:Large eukaryotic DNA virus major capsid protein